jgi:hypothetical protein
MATRRVIPFLKTLFADHGTVGLSLPWLQVVGSYLVYALQQIHRVVVLASFV